MELQRTGPVFSYLPQLNEKDGIKIQADSNVCPDQVSLGRENFTGDTNIFITSVSFSKNKQSSSIYKALVRPHPDVKQARNNTPVVIVHGTLRDRESIMNYLDAALESGHPADLSTYLSIKEGHEIQESGKMVSQRINNSRVEIARENVKTIKSFDKDTQKIKRFFLMENNLYGRNEQGIDQVADLIPGVTDKMDKILNLDKNELSDSFSLKTKQVEEQLAAQVQKTDFALDMDKEQRASVCRKVAEELMDTIAPRAILVGHSMGGFVNHIVALNPKADPDDGNPSTYDGGNGISTVMHLSAPVGKGVKAPLPQYLSDLSYDLAKKYYFNPLEGTPGMQLAMMNPFFAMWYAAGKEMAKQVSQSTANMNASLTNPVIHAQKPGYKQISEGSDFIRTYMDNKQIPKGITFITITSKGDGVSEQDRSVLCESSPNVYNLDVDIKITPQEMHKKYTNTEKNLTHFKMADYPKEHWQEFQTEVIHCPLSVPRLLNNNNFDGMRWNTLKALKDTAERDPGFFKQPEFARAMDSIREVAAERLPFKDSPSYIAKQLLDILEGAVKPNPPQENRPDVWIMSDPAVTEQYL